ncbi:MAG TPA: transposase [Candidatus Limnocylindria bacterium]
MEILIEQYESLEHQIARAEAQLATLTDREVVRRLRTIPGVGAATAAALVAEIGDIFRFDDFDQVVAFAGVHAAERSSGKKGADPETSWHMAKTGDAYLRAALYRMALVGTLHNPVIREHYRRKRAQGKSKMNALGHCMKKALAIVWGVWRGGHDFVVPEGIPS